MVRPAAARADDDEARCGQGLLEQGSPAAVYRDQRTQCRIDRAGARGPNRGSIATAARGARTGAFADHFSGRYARQRGLARAVQIGPVSAHAATPARRIDSRLPREPESRDAQGLDPADSADLLGSLRLSPAND